MKESEFIDAQNLTRLECARELVRQVEHSALRNAECRELRDIGKGMNELIEAIETRLGSKP